MVYPSHVAMLSDKSVSRFREAILDTRINMAIYEKNESVITSKFLVHENILSDKFQYWSVRQDLKKIESSLDVEIFKIGEIPEILKMDLRNEVCELVHLFSAVTGETEPFVSLRTINQEYFVGNQTSVSSCYHRDSAFVTLFQTFLGAGTEWTPNENVIRSAWQKTSIQNHQESDTSYVIDPKNYFTTSNSVIGILKGEAHPPTIDARSVEFIENFISKNEIDEYNVGNSLIHRGPKIIGKQKRLLITVSSFRIPH